MKEKCKDSKCALRTCHNKKKKHKADAFSRSLNDHSPRKHCNISETETRNPGDATGNEAVTAMWKIHFGILLC